MTNRQAARLYLALCLLVLLFGGRSLAAKGSHHWISLDLRRAPYHAKTSVW